MRFMMLVKASKESEAGALPSKELVAAMGRFNEEMAKAGVLVAGEGLHPSSKGVRVAWASRVPFADREVVEVRPVFEAADFPAEVLPPEDAAREQALRDELQRKAVTR